MCIRDRCNILPTLISDVKTYKQYEPHSESIHPYNSLRKQPTSTMGPWNFKCLFQHFFHFLKKSTKPHSKLLQSCSPQSHLPTEISSFSVAILAVERAEVTVSQVRTVG